MNHRRDARHIISVKSNRVLDLTAPHTDPRRCGLCVSRNPFKDRAARDHHIADKHKACPICAQVFELTADRLRHQKAANHCYCAEHNEAFNHPAEVSKHKRAHVHITSFGCIDCQRNLFSDKALNDHLASEGHARVVARATHEAENQAIVNERARRQESNLHCDPCDRTFVDLKAFRQHKESLKHKALSELKCPLSSKCKGTFSSPSALLFHLEGGTCKGGMTRSKVNAIVYQHDNERHITSTSHASQVRDTAISAASQVSIAPDSSASNHARSVFVSSSRTDGSGSVGLTPHDSKVASTLGHIYFTHRDHEPHSSVASEAKLVHVSSASDTSSNLDGDGVLITPSVSTASRIHSVHTPSVSGTSEGGVVLTPTTTMASSSALSDWSFVVNSARIMTPSATSIDRSSVDTVFFDTTSGRWPCPSCPQKFRKKYGLLQHMKSIAHAPKIFHCPTDLPGLPRSRKPTIAFKTLSGLAQHVEAGSCEGGKASLGVIVGIFEKQIQAKLGYSVKLLKA
jgi:hypothetical protein